jgi:hypothetical protein
MAGLGIDLLPAGPTANDACDADAGANGLQNAPVLGSVTTDAATTRVTGTLASAASTVFTIEFYASASCDGSGYGEGATYLGSAVVSTDSSCAATFDVTLPVGVADGTMVTAKAIGPTGATSEFCACSVASGCFAPGEVLGLRLLGDYETLQWESVASAATYDLARGVTSEFPVGTGASETCVAAGVTGSSASDAARPADGGAFWYLVRGRGACGTGGYGTDSSGTPRSTSACP